MPRWWRTGRGGYRIHHAQCINSSLSPFIHSLCFSFHVLRSGKSALSSSASFISSEWCGVCGRRRSLSLLCFLFHNMKGDSQGRPVRLGVNIHQHSLTRPIKMWEGGSDGFSFRLLSPFKVLLRLVRSLLGRMCIEHIWHLIGPIHKVKSPISCRTCSVQYGSALQVINEGEKKRKSAFHAYAKSTILPPACFVNQGCTYIGPFAVAKHQHFSLCDTVLVDWICSKKEKIRYTWGNVWASIKSWEIVIKK